MKHSHRFLALIISIVAVQLAACAKAPEAAQQEPPVKVEHLNSANAASRIILTPEAAKRLDLKTDSVQLADVGGAKRVVVPYASLLYDTEGHTWVYAATDALTFVRTPVQVDSIDGDDVILQSGISAGTSVVTVGAEELFGSETEFEEE